MTAVSVPKPELITYDLPGLGGKIKVMPEDFEVEEIPAYEASGSGGFLYLWIEKRDMGAEYFQRQVARRLDIPLGEVGTAGLKDRRAVTRQMVSVPEGVVDRLKDLDGEGIRVLSVGRHGNKLKAGHLKGNRFRILVREVDTSSRQHLGAIVRRIQENGLPNYYGAQRFGRNGETFHMGLSLLRKETPPSEKRRSFNPFLRKLALSAAQAGLFNHYLTQRIRDGLFRRVLEGDVMAKWPVGGMFVAETIDAEQSRFDARETVTAGPIFGKKTFAPRGLAAARESKILTDWSLQTSDFSSFGKLVQGTRRHNLVYVEDFAAAEESEGIRVTFSLPAGSYATVLLEELMKNGTEGDDEPS